LLCFLLQPRIWFECSQFYAFSARCSKISKLA
jgi:hypothetical protein